MTLTETARHKFCLKAIELKKTIEFNFIELGSMLYEIREKRHYEAGWETWEDYLMEIKILPSSASRLVRIYEVFVMRFKIAPRNLSSIGWATLAEFLPDVTDKTTKKEVAVWLDEANDLTRTDLRRVITERRKGTDMIKCPHKNTYTLKICRDCGDRWSV